MKIPIKLKALSLTKTTMFKKGEIDEDEFYHDYEHVVEVNKTFYIFKLNFKWNRK